MKKLILAFGVAMVSVVSSTAFSAVRFDCSGDENKLTYADGSLTYCLKGCEGIKSFEAGEISQSTSVLGTTFSVLDSTMPDQKNVFVSVVLPEVNLSEELATATFKTKIVVTTAKTSFAGSAGVKGVVQKSKYFGVKCKAVLQ